MRVVDDESCVALVFCGRVEAATVGGAAVRATSGQQPPRAGPTRVEEPRPPPAPNLAKVSAQLNTYTCIINT